MFRMAWRMTQKQISRETSLAKYDFRKSGGRAWSPSSSFVKGTVLHNHGGKNRLEKKFKKYSRKINALGVYINIRRYIIEVNSEGLRWKLTVSHFVNPDLRVEIFFKKEGEVGNGGTHSEIGDVGTSAHLYWRLNQLTCKDGLLCFFIVSLVTKNNVWKLSLRVIKLYQ